ncbi:hypothetical protein BDP27DRAFT_819528 [Rhodocollybia butyracea]|uniref:Uncharacterized protein n=1 Tax=Rhodocollybia butyracea TaxID=206335 RepID=A0A9P5P5U9_9AGAR|nr:hypothetical protein BDP27DRAFT_819528 [Rhodocollybia butyracea]
MSGPVRHKSRAASRAFSSSPYSRSDTKKSSWSISGLLNYFNPLRSRYLSQEGSEAGIRDTSHAAAAETLSSRAPQISSASDATNHPSPAPLEFAQPPPSSASSLSPTNATFGGHDVSPETQQQGLEYLSKYLGERPRDEPLSTSEAEELISIIKKSTPGKTASNAKREFKSH